MSHGICVRLYLMNPRQYIVKEVREESAWLPHTADFNFMVSCHYVNRVNLWVTSQRNPVVYSFRGISCA